ncbi:MAG TPA: hypothetical protein VJ883_13755 [Woeseiaceae bacterium]|nr:hypothetical protein [Woeseiaceae bacterium]
MTRLLGFLSGLLLVAALAVAAVRYPPAEPFRDQGGRVDEPGRDGESRESGHGKPADDRVPEAAPAPGPGAPEPASAAATEERGDAVAADAPPEPPAPVPPPAAAPGAQIDHAERQWYAFWQPFRSEISAKGFRRRLEGVTGLDYRVLSPQPGEYQVAFAYRDEAERLAHLAAIEAATGLVLRSRML